MTRRTRARLLLTIAAMTLATSCARGAGHDAAVDSAGAAHATHDSALSSTTSSRLVVTERGIGPLRAGMRPDDAALGDALALPAGSDTTGCRYVAWKGGPGAPTSIPTDTTSQSHPCRRTAASRWSSRLPTAS